MPELPEVERGRRLAERVGRRRRIVGLRCARDDIVFDGVGPASFHRALKNRTINAVRRRGKIIWFILDGEGPHPVFHFGMTGQFRVRDVSPLRYRSSPKSSDDGAWPPKWMKIWLIFDDGGELVMTNKRRLGRIRLRDRPECEPPVSDLGFDPLLDLPSPIAFARQLRARKAPLKAVLLDQSFAAGVGNWIADEVLYQAKIDPLRRADELSVEEAKRVRSKLKHVIERAVAVNADKSKFPRTWLFHHRWGRNSDARTVRGEKIEHMTIAGRTTAWVPAVQV